MCGRFALFNMDGFCELFDFCELSGVYNPLPEVNLSYNISPGTEIPVVCDGNENGIVFANWGIRRKSSFFNDFKENLVVNVRDDTLKEVRFFRDGLEKHRCAIPANGFYEWNKTGKIKVPFFVRTTDQPIFAFAGVYEPAGDNSFYCSIITTSSNEKIKDVHDRMPVILAREDVSGWIKKENDDEYCLSLLSPYPAEKTVYDVVGSEVNSTSGDGPSLIKPAYGGGLGLL